MFNPSQWAPGNCLFVFGSLMDHDVLELVSDMPIATLSIREAEVEGFRQCEVREESYPVLVADKSAKCRGLLVGGLTTVAVERILFFEGDEYTLEPITVSVENADEEITGVYYFSDTGAYTVRAESWNFDHWQQHHKSPFIAASAAYMNLFGQMSAAEADARWLEITGQSDSVAEPSNVSPAGISPCAELAS